MTRAAASEWTRWGVSAALLAGAALLLARAGPQAERATVAAAVDAATGELEKKLVQERPGSGGEYPSVLVFENDAARHAKRLHDRLARSTVVKVSDAGLPLVVDLRIADAGTTLMLGYGPASRTPVTVTHERAPITPWAVLPPLLAIVLAFATGRLVFSLLVAIFSGALLVVGPNPLAFVWHTLRVYFWDATLTDPFKLWILVFTTALLGLVQLATRAGGVQGVVDRIAVLARSARSTKVATVLMGGAVFFDDYANTILVGGTMRPLTDRMRISREKLAYLVDSTSAPVAGVAIISTWIGYEVGLFTDVAQGLGLDQDGYQIFFAALPFRFYCLFTLLFLALLLIFDRDFGPMLDAERRAFERGEVLRPGAVPLADTSGTATAPREGIPHLAHVALLPIGLVLAATILGLFADGGGFATLKERPSAFFSFTEWRRAFGAADHSTFILAMSALAGSALLFGLVLGRRLLPVREALAAYRQGVVSMYLAVVILILAWGIKAACDDVGTSYFLAAGLEGLVSPALLPALIFILAAIVAFSTGTSWGTMGILIPTAAPLAFHLGGIESMYVALAAVLDGAIFGDHCSPISDTTLMSSIASGSDHMDHVRTQVPYAMVSVTAALGCGYLWEAGDLPYWPGFALGVLAMGAVIRGLGRRVRSGP